MVKLDDFLDNFSLIPRILRYSKAILHNLGEKALNDHNFLHRIQSIDSTTTSAFIKTTTNISSFHVNDNICVYHMKAPLPEEECHQHNIIYVHGGAFVLPCMPLHIMYAQKLNTVLNANVFMPLYSLAPDSIYPKALNDVMIAHEHIINEYNMKPSNMYFIGDSAGGNLISGLMLKYIDDQKYNMLPKGCILLSPWLDLQAQGRSYTELADIDPLIPTELVIPYGKLYYPYDNTNIRSIPDYKWRKSYFSSPILAPTHLKRHFPKTLIHVGEREILLSDSLDFAHNSAHVKVETFPQMWHGFSLLTRHVTNNQSDKSFEKVVTFIQEQDNKQ